MKKLFGSLLLCFLLLAVQAQDKKPPFWDDIQAFKKKDSIQMPAKHQILFVGSSSFTKWTDVQDYFPGYPILNRGFGGSTLLDVIRYREDVIFKYDPKQILIYCGENDFAYADTLSPETAVARFTELFGYIRARYPKVPLAYVSMKPSASRAKFMPRYVIANKAIADFLHKKRKAVFIDVYPAMLDADGNPIGDIFVEDHLHMNAKGYQIWQKIIAPYLLKK